MNLYLLSFFWFSFLGWCWESVYCTACQKKWANRGFLYGPICPIYGFGGAIGLAVFDLTATGLLPVLTWWQIFIAGFMVSMILEYPTSYLLEKIFHARWWDYSGVPLNIHGRTSVPTSIAFGGAAILAVKVIIPFTVGILSSFPSWLTNLLALLAIALISADLTLTLSALTDFAVRVSRIDKAFQNHMTESVSHLIESKNRLYAAAVARIATFHYSKSKKAIAEKMREKRFDELIEPYAESPEVRTMDQFIQHGTTTTLEHCKNVAWISFLINERLHLNADEKELVEAAMLHDFYLYDWHDGKPERKRHGFDHPEIAEKNAERVFAPSDKVKDAIKSHMWPLNITKIPKSKEAILLCLVDKYCAIVEVFRKKGDRPHSK